MGVCLSENKSKKNTNNNSIDKQKKEINKISYPKLQEDSRKNILKNEEKKNNEKESINSQNINTINNIKPTNESEKEDLVPDPQKKKIN